MKKMNKKGFTLIEMLVVIAIIAVLVAIVIPTVTSATDKAAAATNAANLRSYKASLTTSYLAGETKVAADGTPTIAANVGAAPTAKKMAGVEEGSEVIVEFNTTTKAFTVYFGDKVGDADTKKYTVNDFAKAAEGAALTGTTITATPDPDPDPDPEV